MSMTLLLLWTLAAAFGLPAPTPFLGAAGTVLGPDSAVSDLDILRSSGLLFPVAGRTAASVENSFRQRRGENRRHHAIDIPARRGTPVVSTDSGRILKLHRSAAGGLMIYATDPRERFIYYYAHLDGYRRGLRAGQTVARGDTIGYVGTTGNAPAHTPHLHFAILRSTNIKRWSRGTPINPYDVFVKQSDSSVVAR